MSEVLTLSGTFEVIDCESPRRNVGRAVEDFAVFAALALIVVLPLAEIVLRKLIGIGISGSATLVQHLTLVISMVGAAVAARDSRLLSLASTTFMTGRVRKFAAIVSGAVGGSTTAFLAIASFRFVWTERAGGKILAYGIPVWVVQLVLPIGFAIIAARLIWHASDHRKGRLLALAIAPSISLIFVVGPFSPHQLAVPALIALFCAAILGAPVFVVLAGMALILFWREAVPIAAVVVGHYSLVVNPSLPAIPLFTLAGYLLAEGGASRRLVDV